MHLIVQYYQVKYENQPQDLINKRQAEITKCLTDKEHFDYLDEIDNNDKYTS